MSLIKDKLKVASSRIFGIVKTPGFNIFVGTIIVIMSIYDIAEDFSKIRKEHLTLIIGILLIIDSINDLIVGTQKILTLDNRVEGVTFMMRIKKILKSPAYYIFIGIVIILTSVYDIYEDFSQMSKEHLGLIVGIIYILIALKSGFDGGKKAFLVLEKESVQAKI